MKYLIIINLSQVISMFPAEIIGCIEKYCNYPTYKSLLSTSKLYYKNTYNHINLCHYVLDSIINNLDKNSEISVNRKLGDLFIIGCYYNDTRMLKLIIEKGYLQSIIDEYDDYNFQSLKCTNESFIRYLIKYLFENKLTRIIYDYILLIITELNYSRLLKDTIKQYLEYSEYSEQFRNYRIHHTIMEKACQIGNLEIIKFLMKQNLINAFENPRGNYKFDFSGYKIACKYGNDNIAKYMIEFLIVKNLPIRSKKLLRRALSYKRYKVVKFLLKHCKIKFSRDYQVSQVTNELLLTHNEELIGMFIELHPLSRDYNGSSKEIENILKSENCNCQSLNYIFDNFPHLVDGVQYNRYDFDPVIKNYIERERMDLLKLLITKVKISLDFNMISECTQDRDVIEEIISLSDY